MEAGIQGSSWTSERLRRASDIDPRLFLCHKERQRQVHEVAIEAWCCRSRWLVRTGVLARHSEVQAPASQRPASYTSTSACVLQTLPARSCGDTTCLLGNSTTRTGPSRTTSPRKTRPFSTDGDPFNWLPPRDRPHEDHGHNQRILKLWRHWSSIWSCSHYRRRGCSLKCYSSYNFVRCLLSSPHL
jgi:hypothetical protein